MNIIVLRDTIEEAERFLEKAKAARGRWKQDWDKDSKKFGLINPTIYRNYSPENAACKRASIDLTRMLALLRKP